VPAADFVAGDPDGFAVVSVEAVAASLALLLPLTAASPLPPAPLVLPCSVLLALLCACGGVLVLDCVVLAPALSSSLSRLHAVTDIARTMTAATVKFLFIDISTMRERRVDERPCRSQPRNLSVCPFRLVQVSPASTRVTAAGKHRTKHGRRAAVRPRELSWSSTNAQFCRNCGPQLIDRKGTRCTAAIACVAAVQRALGE
jgi:hypothetical protein